MTARQVRRARERETRRAQQRSERLLAGVGAGTAALGATVVFAPAAEAATFTVSNLNNAGAGSLRQAVLDANAAAGDDTVVFQAGLSGTIQLAGADSDIEIYNQGIAIQGPGATQVTVDGGGTDRIFTIYGFTNPDEAVSISGLTLTDGFTTFYGGALYSDTSLGSAPELTISDSVLTDSRADVGGGAIWQDMGSLTITGSTVSGNSAGGDGGGVLSANTDGDQPVEVAIRNSTISGNTADDDGGGIRLYESDGAAVIEDSRISGNTAGSDGGGASLYDSASDITIRNSTVSGNTASDDGGGLVFYDNQAVTIEGSTVSANQAQDYGGGIALFGSRGPTLIQNTTVSGNRADSDGSGDGEGGGIGSYNFRDTPRTIRNSTIAGNSAEEGGGVYAYQFDNPEPGADVLAASSTIIADNTASVTDPDLGGNDPAPANTRFDVGFSLIENLGQTQITETPAGSNIIGVDPQLGPLADNGGPTQTQLPALTSPALDAGIANGLATDQRGLARTFDASNIANRPGSDATDIGATELVAEGQCKGKAATVLFAPGQPITGSAAKDVIVGTAAKDKIRSGGGKDTVCGGGGKDKVKGQGGKDTLLGQAGKDRLSGGAGKDKLKGGAGKDRLIGGPGKDKLNGGPGKDTEIQ